MFKKLWNKITGKDENTIKEQSHELEQQESSQECSEQERELRFEQDIQEFEIQTFEVQNIEHHTAFSVEEPLIEEDTVDGFETDVLQTDDLETSSLETDILQAEASEAGALQTDVLQADALETGALQTNDLRTSVLQTDTLQADASETDALQTDILQAEALETGALQTNAFEAEDAKEEEYLDESADFQEEEQKPKKGFFKKLFEGLDKTRKNITDKIDNLINHYDKIDDDLFDELEEILIMSDISMDTSMALIASLREELVKRKITDASLVKSTLRDVIVNFLNTEEEAKISDHYPTIILVIGVNGAGKTTTIGKLANKYKTCGKSVILAAADTFRAAAIDQLQVWGNRSGVRVIAHSEGSDPSAVIFDAINAAKSSKTGILICDTAGRLHNKVNLMNELNKMFRIMEREYPEANKEVLIVLDATTGQNALNQAKLFKEVADITGLVLTKLDGAAKGGFVLSIKHDLGIPLKLIGVGEGIDDLQEFNPLAFANALMDFDEKSEI